MKPKVPGTTHCGKKELCQPVLHNVWCLAPFFFFAMVAWSAEPLPKELEGVTIAEHLGTRLDLTLTFTNTEGQTIPLKTFFHDDKPVLLTLNYYECPSLCTLQLNALVSGLKGLPWAPGETFRMVTISIDHTETAELAQAKQQAYINTLHKGSNKNSNAEWHFLVGTQENIHTLTSSLGFSFKYDPEQDQFAHPAAIFFIAPDGTVSRYLYGIHYSTQDLKFALLDTAAGRLGSPIDKILLSCFHYDPSRGRYGPFAFGMMRVGGVLTILLLGGWLIHLWQRDRRKLKGVRSP